MPGTTSRKKASKSRSRTLRLALYALVLLAALLYQLREGMAVPALMTAFAEQEYADEEIGRTRRFQAAHRRRAEADALIKNAEATQNPDEQSRLYDEMLEKHRDEESFSIQNLVLNSLADQAGRVKDAQEKARLLGAIVGRFCDTTDSKMRTAVRSSLIQIMKSAKGADEKNALCDSMIEKYGSRLPNSLAAWFLNEKALATRDRAVKIGLYEAMHSRFLSSDDNSAFELALTAVANEMRLVPDGAEQIRLCDAVIDAFLKTPGRKPFSALSTAVRKKSQLSEDPSLALALWNRIIDADVGEETTAQARLERLILLKDRTERLAACSEILAAHQNSTSDLVQYTVLLAMNYTAIFLPPSDGKTALLRSVIEKSKTVKDARAKYEAERAAGALSQSIGGADFAAQYYDGVIAESKKLRDVIHAMESKARLLRDPAEKIRAYDEIISRAEKSDESRFRSNIVKAMYAKARLLDGKKEKERLYDEIIARGGSAGDQTFREIVAQAMLAKAEITGDRKEKIRLYDAVLFGTKEVRGRHFLSDAFEKRVGLETGTEGKLRLFDRFIAVEGDELDPDDRASLLLKKADMMTDAAEKMRGYDEIIELCGKFLTAEKKESGQPNLSGFEKDSLMNSLGGAILGKAALLENAEAKVALYDQFLALPRSDGPSFMGRNTEKILAAKAELLGDSSIKTDYYDEQIRKAADDRAKVRWYQKKAEAAGSAEERAAIDDEMIAKFFDSTDENVESAVAMLLFRKIRRTSDPAEQGRLCDRLIERYGNSTDRFGTIISAVVRARIMKAEAEKDERKRLELYTAIIEQYKDSDEFFLKDIVNDAIAARFRLEEKLKMGK